MDYNGFYFHIANNKIEKVTLKFQRDIFVFSYEGQENVKIKKFELKNITLSNNYNRKEFHQNLTNLMESSLVSESLNMNSIIR